MPSHHGDCPENGSHRDRSAHAAPFDGHVAQKACASYDQADDQPYKNIRDQPVPQPAPLGCSSTDRPLGHRPELARALWNRSVLLAGTHDPATSVRTWVIIARWPSQRG